MTFLLNNMLDANGKNKTLFMVDAVHCIEELPTYHIGSRTANSWQTNLFDLYTQQASRQKCNKQKI